MVTDYDGNIYSTVQIGNQVWTVENFRGTHYNDGMEIPEVIDPNEWCDLTSGARCYYDNDSEQYAEKYGALYNWFAVYTGKLAPEGWHVPTVAEWMELKKYLIANGYHYDGSTRGNEIGKSLAAKTDWRPSTYEGDVGNDMPSNNRTGFTAFPGGCRRNDGMFHWKTLKGVFHSSGTRNGGETPSFVVDGLCLRSLELLWEHGVSVRFIKD